MTILLIVAAWVLTKKTGGDATLNRLFILLYALIGLYTDLSHCTTCPHGDGMTPADIGSRYQGYRLIREDGVYQETLPIMTAMEERLQQSLLVWSLPREPSWLRRLTG